MQITINISNKHAAVFGTLLFIITVSIVADYASSAPPLQWHSLSEITVGGIPIESTTTPGKINTSFISTINSAEVSFNYAGSSSKGGAATTATALATDGSNCAIGQYAAGIDTNGNAQGCGAPPSVPSGYCILPAPGTVSCPTGYTSKTIPLLSHSHQLHPDMYGLYCGVWSPCWSSTGSSGQQFMCCKN